MCSKKERLENSDEPNSARFFFPEENDGTLSMCLNELVQSRDPKLSDADADADADVSSTSDDRCFFIPNSEIGNKSETAADSMKLFFFCGRGPDSNLGPWVQFLARVVSVANIYNIVSG